MFKKLKGKILLVIFFISIISLSIIMVMNAEDEGKYLANNFSSEMMIDSMLYTGMDDLSINTNKGVLKEDDKLITTSSNGLYSLYFNDKLCIFKIENKTTGYIYSSALDEIPNDTSSEYYGGFLSSSFSISYYRYLTSTQNFDLNTSRAWLTKASNYTRKEKETMTEEEASKFKLKIADDTEYSHQRIPNGVKVNIKFANAKETNDESSYSLGIKLSCYVTLDNDGLHVKIPREEIIEENDRFRLANIIVMPALGSTREDSCSGYMVVPDGSGALVRYGSVSGDAVSQQNYSYFGDDRGIVSTSSDSGTYNSFKSLTAPIFGMVNGINQDGLLGVLENGSTQAGLTVSPSGSFRIKQNLIYPTFKMRFVYYLYGITFKLVDELFNDDISLSYRFLSNEDANYVGMARSYQKYLIDNKLLSRRTSGKYQNSIDILMSDVKSSLFGYQNVTMTSLSDVKEIVNELTNNNINPLLCLKGWNEKGYSGSTPYTLYYNTSLGSKSSFIKYLKELDDKGIDLYLNDSYLTGYTRGNFRSSNTAKSLLKLRMQYYIGDDFLFSEYNYINPTYTNTLAKKLVDKGESKLGLKNISLEGIGNALFSYYDNDKNNTRFDCYKTYKDTLDILNSKYKIALNNPNTYFYQYTDVYYNMPSYANAFHLYSDNIPLIPYILKGYIDYYGNYLNYNSLGDLGILRYLDYGSFPSFILTKESSHKLKYTNAVDYYTTAYKDWKEEIFRINDKYSKGYLATINSVVINRDVLEIGVVKVVYQNLDNHKFTSLYINYNNKQYSNGSITIEPLSYLVKEGR